MKKSNAKYTDLGFIRQNEFNVNDTTSIKLNTNIDVIECILYANVDTIKSLKNKTIVYNDIFYIISTKKAFSCNTYRYGDGFETTLTDDSCIFKFSSIFLLNHSPENLIDCVIYFYHQLGITYDSNYIIRNLNIYYIECCCDILATPVTLHQLNTFCDYVNSEIHGSVKPLVPHIAIDRIINHSFSNKKLHAHAGDDIEIIEPFFNSDKKTKNPRSKVKIYNKLLASLSNYKKSFHWINYYHRNGYFNFTDEQFTVFHDSLLSLEKDERIEIYNTLKSNGFSILRLEFCLDSSYLKQIIAGGNEQFKQFKSFYNVISKHSQLFLHCLEIWQPKMVLDSGRMELLPIIQEIQNQLLNGDIDLSNTNYEIGYDETSMNQKILKNESRIRGYYTGINNIISDSHRYYTENDDHVAFLKSAMEKSSATTKLCQEILNGYGVTS